MTSLIIVGSGGLTRKILHKLRQINDQEERYIILGVLDDNKDNYEKIKDKVDYLGTIKDHEVNTEARYVLGVSDPKLKEKLATLLKDKGATFETLIDPRADLGDDVTFGEGCLIFTPHIIDCGATFGDFVTVMGSTISFDAKIGDYSTLTGFANTTTATLGKRVYVGSHAVILEGLHIGDDAHIGAGSIVLKDVAAGEQVFGVPARNLPRK